MAAIIGQGFIDAWKVRPEDVPEEEQAAREKLRKLFEHRRRSYQTDDQDNPPAQAAESD